MSNNAYDYFLDVELEKYYEEVEDLEVPWPDEPVVEPNNDYDNYDGWDDMQ
jgi:hypothetical protein